VISDVEELLVDIRTCMELTAPGTERQEGVEHIILSLLERTVQELREHQHRYNSPIGDSWALTNPPASVRPD
jgi:hypothetical protein